MEGEEQVVDTGGGDSSVEGAGEQARAPDNSAKSYGAIADAAAREAAQDALDSEGKPKPRERKEPAAGTKAAKFMRRTRDDKGEVKEEEWDEERLAKFLDDDWEDEFEIDKQKVSIPRHEQRRLIRPAAASFKAMRDAAERQKAIDAKEARVREDLLGFADEAMGHEEADDASLPPDLRQALGGMRITRAQLSVLQGARKVLELAAMKGANPDAYIKEHQRIADARLQVRQQREQQERAATEKRQRLDAGIPQALSEAGLDDTPENRYRFFMVHAPAEQSGYDMPLREAAHHVRQQLQTEVRGYISKMDGPTLHKFLGPELTKALRAVELGKVAQATKPPAQVVAEPKRAAGTPIKKKTLWSV